MLDTAEERSGSFVFELPRHPVEKYRPKVKTRRRPSIKRRYLQRVGKVWRSAGLNVGRAHNGAKIESVESPFQHFARLALLAVGDSSGIAVRQIVNVQAKLRLAQCRS
jgi:hypothetical protein